MRKLIAIILTLWIALLSCGKDDVNIKVEEPEEELMSLKVVNSMNSSYYVTSVKFVGYRFETLKIESGKSQTFQLDNGMPGGLENINVVVRYTSTPHTAGWTKSLSLNFASTGVTTLTLRN